MTKAQRIANKIGNQQRKARLLRLCYKVKSTSKGWMPLGGVCQNGRHTIETGIPVYDNTPNLAS
jgi:hypothetical protein